MYLRGRLESQVRVGVIPEVAGARDLVCMKNFGVFGRVQKASTNGAHWWHSKVILKGSRIVNLLFTRRGGVGGGGGAGKTTARCFLGEVRRTPSGGLKLSYRHSRGLYLL